MATTAGMGASSVEVIPNRLICARPYTCFSRPGQSHIRRSRHSRRSRWVMSCAARASSRTSTTVSPSRKPRSARRSALSPRRGRHLRPGPAARDRHPWRQGGRRYALGGKPLMIRKPRPIRPRAIRPRPVRVPRGRRPRCRGWQPRCISRSTRSLAGRPRAARGRLCWPAHTTSCGCSFSGSRCGRCTCACRRRRPRLPAGEAFATTGGVQAATPDQPIPLAQSAVEQVTPNV